MMKQTKSLGNAAHLRARHNCRKTPKVRVANVVGGITVKPNEAEIKTQLKWAGAMLGTKENIEFDKLTFAQYIFGGSHNHC